MHRSPGQLASAAVWLSRALEHKGRNPHRGVFWITREELTQLSDFRRHPPMYYLVETDAWGRPTRMCGLKLYVLAALASHASGRPGA